MPLARSESELEVWTILLRALSKGTISISVVMLNAKNINIILNYQYSLNYKYRLTINTFLFFPKIFFKFLLIECGL